MSRSLLSRTSAATRFLIIAVVLLASGAYLARASRAEELPPRTPLALLPLNIDGWNGRADSPLTQRVIDVLGVDDYLLRTYVKGNEAALGLYIGYHSSQRQGDTIHSPLNCLPAGGWTPL